MLLAYIWFGYQQLFSWTAAKTISQHMSTGRLPCQNLNSNLWLDRYITSSELTATGANVALKCQREFKQDKYEIQLQHI
jgi:hypothetical protein